MVIVGLLSWWYTVGWKQQVVRIGARLASTYDYFSIDLLVRTLFAPFRQISAGRGGGSLGQRWRAFVDRLVSRCIGAIVRLIIIVVGFVTLVLTLLIGGVLIVLWGIVPVAPLIGVMLMIIGWVPTWM